MDIQSMTLRQAAAALRKGDLTTVALVNQLLDDIEKRGDELNAYIFIDREKALKQAEEADAALARDAPGELLGVPIAIKDNISVTGEPLECCSAILEGYHAPFDATAVSRLKAAGALIVGRTNMDELALGSTTTTSIHGKTINPHAADRMAGGSSGGSAAAVAGGLALAALGSDTGGSVRQPASWCGCVGFKSSHGVLSRYGLAACAGSLDQLGTFTKDIHDTALLLDVMKGVDNYDVKTIEPDTESYLEGCDGGIEGLRIGIPREYYNDDLDAETDAKLKELIRICADGGARIIDVSLPHTRFVVAAYQCIASAEAATSLARFDGVRYGKRSPNSGTLGELYSNTRGEYLGRDVKRRLLLGAFVTSGDNALYYRKALAARKLIRKDFDEVFKSCDVLLTPTVTAPARRFPAVADNPVKRNRDELLTAAANLAGLPGLALPIGFSQNGLPLGAQIMGPRGADRMVLRAGAACQSLLAETGRDAG